MEHIFYHISRSVKNLDSFLKEGIQPSRSSSPAGGQCGGFFVFSDETTAYKDFADFHFLREGLLISVKVNPDDLEYPNWQHDLERNRTIKNLIISQITQQDPETFDKIYKAFKNTSFKTGLVDGTITGIVPSQDTFTIHYDDNDTGRGRGFIYHSGDFEDRSDWTGLTQVLSDKLIKLFPKYKEEYNEALKKSLEEPWCLKYTGTKKLPIFEIYKIHKNKDGIWEKEKVERTDEISPLTIARLKGNRR